MTGKEIKSIRRKLGLTQPELAEKLGVHVRTIQNWERFGSMPLESYEKLCGFLPQPEMTHQQYYGGNVEQANVHGDNIRNQDSGAEVPRLLSLLEARDKSLAKSQEQIDSLISVIKKLTNTSSNEKEDKGQ